MNFVNLKIEREIATVTLNRPEKHNSFNYGMLKELKQIFTELAEDKQVRAVILTGAGEKSFCSGVDLNEMVAFSSMEQARDFALLLEDANMALLQFPKPLIAAMNGHAFGGGYGLASSADVRLLTPEAKIGFPAVRLGAVLPMGCTLRLNAIIGSGHSRELLLTGRTVDAQEARRIGLVHFIVPRENLMAEAKRITAEILQGSDTALVMTKQMVNQELLSQIRQYSPMAAENFAYLAFTDDWKNRIRAFVGTKEQ